MTHNTLFGSMVRERRRALDLTQAELAQLVGCATDMVRKIEAGRRRPSRQIATLLAERLRIPTAERTRFLAAARALPAEQATPVRLPQPPAALGALIGREHDLALVAGLFQRGARLVTIIGPGGVGKTRLAAEAARAATYYAEGAVWVALASAATPDDMLTLLSQALLVRVRGAGTILEDIVQRLQGQRVLLVLDNLEHLLDGTPQIGHLLAACPLLTILATSRAALRLSGEHMLPLQPLEQTPAIQLLAERARAIDPTFQPTSANTNALASICRQTDGLPLAIELAAARLRLLTPDMLAAMLGDMGHTLGLLAHGPSDLPPRQQSLRGVVEWSYSLLSPELQHVFRQLAVFRGGWTLEAAVAIAPEQQSATAPVAMIDSLQTLANNSLLQVTQHQHGTRFDMLQIIWAFAHEQLEIGGEREQAEWRRAKYFLRFAEHTAKGFEGARQRVALDQFDAEQANLRVTLEWLRDHNHPAEALRLAVAESRYWAMRSRYAEAETALETTLAAIGENFDDAFAPVVVNAIRWYAMALLRAGQTSRAMEQAERGVALAQRSEDEGALAAIRNSVGVIAISQAQYELAETALRQSIEHYRRCHDEYGEAQSLNDLGEALRTTDRYEEARTCYAPALAIRRAIGDKRGEAGTLNNLGILTAMTGDYEQAQIYLEESMAIEQELKNPRSIAISYMNLAHVARHSGNLAKALDNTQFGLATFAALGDRSNVAIALATYAMLRADAGEPLVAARFFGAADTLRDHIGEPMPQNLRAFHNEQIERSRLAGGPSAFDIAYQAGSQTPLNELLAEASL